MPGWFAQISPAFSNAQAKQLALLVACAIVAFGLIPLSRVQFASLPPGERKIYPRDPFIWRFLPALAVWSLVTGSLSPLSNVYFSQYLRVPLKSMGIIFSLSQLLQVFGVLAAPFLFRKLGLVSGIASTQLAAAVLLGLLAATSGPLSAPIIYVGFTAFLWMSEPGLFTLLMDRVAPGEQAGASSLNFLVISVSQAIAVAMTGSAFLRVGYPLSLASIAALAAISAASFWLLLGRGFSTARKPQTAAPYG
jgi:predicted MFS family arabinose efflux permease